MSLDSFGTVAGVKPRVKREASPQDADPGGSWLARLAPRPQPPARGRNRPSENDLRQSAGGVAGCDRAFELLNYTLLILVVGDGS